MLTVWPAQAQTTTITTFAGNGSAAFSGDGGSAGFAALNHPRGLAVSSTGQIYIADVDNFRIRTVSPSGMILTFAGNGLFGATGDGGPAANASFSDVTGLALDTAGNLYVADAGNRRAEAARSRRYRRRMPTSPHTITPPPTPRSICSIFSGNLERIG
jgi:DNA-binding beta-propeller fold protein YncE